MEISVSFDNFHSLHRPSTFVCRILRFVALNSVESERVCVCAYLHVRKQWMNRKQLLFFGIKVNENVTLLICSHEFQPVCLCHFFNYFQNIASANLINVCRSVEWLTTIDINRALSLVKPYTNCRCIYVSILVWLHLDEYLFSLYFS